MLTIWVYPEGNIDAALFGYQAKEAPIPGDTIYESSDPGLPGRSWRVTHRTYSVAFGVLRDVIVQVQPA